MRLGGAEIQAVTIASQQPPCYGYENDSVTVVLGGKHTV